VRRRSFGVILVLGLAAIALVSQLHPIRTVEALLNGQGLGSAAEPQGVDPAMSAAPLPSDPSTYSSSPIVVRTNDVTIDGARITGSDGTGVAIEVYGTVSNPVRNVTIRNCRIDGFNTAIEARNVVNLVIDHCTITNAGYAGIVVFSGSGGRITGNTIERIGPQTRPSVDVNAYGIALTRSASLSLAASPRTTGMVVSGNLVTDVPTWHGIDTHAGANLTFANNTIQRTMRAFFITGDTAGNAPEAITITGNRVQSAKSFAGNLAAVTLVGLQGGSITSNEISETYPTPHVYDDVTDGGGSLDLTISNNTVIP
jgi:parallel beta-helix repeat protein